MPGKNGVERRKNERVSFEAEVEVAGAGSHRSVELSVAGIYLAAKRGFRPKDSVDLRFKLLGSDTRPISVKARVLYVNEGAGVGLGFLDLLPEDRERIGAYIRQGKDR